MGIFMKANKVNKRMIMVFTILSLLLIITTACKNMINNSGEGKDNIIIYNTPVASENTSKPHATSESPVETGNNLEENKYNNQNNESLIAQNGDDIYYAGISGGLNKLNLITEEEKQIVDDQVVSCIQIDNDWIYYISGDRYYSPNLYKVKSDGTSKALLIEMCQEYILSSNFIYYIDRADHLMYRIGLNSANKEALTEKSVAELLFYDNNIYFVFLNDSFVYRYNTTSGKIDNILKVRCFNISIVDNWLYFINIDDNRLLYKVSIDGGELISITSHPIFSYNLNERYIFYTYGNLYRSDLDGNDIVTFETDESIIGNISLLEDYIFYDKDGSEGHSPGVMHYIHYIMKFDGSQKKEFY